MRTSRLRRWLLRGALLSAAVAPLAGGAALADEWQWEKTPTVSVPSEPAPAPDTETIYLTELYEWQWE